MTPVKRSVLKQYAVYWARAGTVAGSGQSEFADPVVIRCRWDERQEQFIGPGGETRTSRAVLMTDRLLDIKGVVLKIAKPGAGETGLEQVDDLNDPFFNEGAAEVYGNQETPNRRATKALWMAYL